MYFLPTVYSQMPHLRMCIIQVQALCKIKHQNSKSNIPKQNTTTFSSKHKLNYLPVSVHNAMLSYRDLDVSKSD